MHNYDFFVLLRGTQKYAEIKSALKNIFGVKLRVVTSQDRAARAKELGIGVLAKRTKRLTILVAMCGPIRICFHTALCCLTRNYNNESDFWRILVQFVNFSNQLLLQLLYKSGRFTFRFWSFGEWVEVSIDDRLPTVRENGVSRLIFARNDDEPDEFWVSLMEKAFVK